MRCDDGLIAAQGLRQAVGNVFMPAFRDQRCRRLDVLDANHGARPQLQSVEDRFAVRRADGCEGVSVNVHVKSSSAIQGRLVNESGDWPSGVVLFRKIEMGQINVENSIHGRF